MLRVFRTFAGESPNRYERKFGSSSEGNVATYPPGRRVSQQRLCRNLAGPARDRCLLESQRRERVSRSYLLALRHLPKQSHQCWVVAGVLVAAGERKEALKKVTLCRALLTAPGMLSSMVKTQQACKTSKAGVKPRPKPLHRRAKPAKPDGFI